MLERNGRKVIQEVSSLPLTGSEKYIYYNTTDGYFYGWNSVTNSFDNLSIGGSTVSIQSSSSTKPSNPKEGDELIVTDNGLISGVVTEQWIYDATTSAWIQRPNDKVLDVLTTVQTAPTIGGGNTTNLGKIFKDASGNTYIVDYSGEAIQLSSPDVVTDITSITNGFRYTNESNQNDDITFEVNNTNPQNVKVEVKLNGTKVAEFPLYTVNNDIQINNTGSEWDLTDDKITILETNGDSQTITFPYRVTVVANPNGTIDIKQNGVTIGTIPAPAADIAYSKMLFVDPINGNDTTGTGSDNNMFKTIAKALTVANGSGYRIVLGAGTYTENPTISLPNIDIVTVAGSDRGNTVIQGTVTFTHTSSSSGIQGIAMTNLVHSGAGALYVTDCQINTLLNKTSTGYIEVTDTQLQGTSTSTLSAGTGLIKDSLIANMTISGATSGYTLKSNIIDATGAVTYTGGAFYNIQDNSGNIVTTAGTNMETGLIAQGLSSALAKQFVTDFSNKLGMINPDTNNSNTNVVSWNTTTKRLEVSNLPSTTVVQTNTSGKQIGTVNGTALFETVTSLGTVSITGNTLSISYVDENGATTTRTATIPSDVVTTLTNALSTGNRIGTYTNESGTVVNINETITTMSLTGTTLSYTNEAGVVTNVTIPQGSNVTFGTAVPTSTTANEGDEYFITSNGLSTGSITASYIYDATSSSWILRPSGVTAKTTTSLTAQYGNGTTHVNALATGSATVADVLRLSDGSLVNNEDKITWTGHGLAIHNWYFLSATTAGGYTNTPPASPNLSQRLFYVEDANTIKVNIQEALATDTAAGNAVLRANWTGPTSIANGAFLSNFTNISLNTIPSTWNNSTGTFTAATAGFYMVALALSGSANVAAGQFLEITVVKNGNTEQSFLSQANAAGSSFNLCLSGAVPVYLAVNDTIRFRVGSSLTFTSHVNSTYFSITQL